MRLDELFGEVMEFSPGTEAGFPGGGGVYLLTDEEDRIVQLGTAGDLRRALRGRLLAPVSAEQVEPTGRLQRLELSRIVRRIRWQTAHSQFELTWKYYRLARVLMPNEYLRQVAFGPAWFLHIDPEAAIPSFTVGKVLRSPPGVDLGPFGAQSDATRLLQILQDGFDLCRYEHILAQAPDGERCAYYEMGRCPAPCDGSMPMAEYRARIAAAVEFAEGRRDALYDDLERQMLAAARDRAYERAASLKQRLERARGAEHESFRHVGRANEFNYLVVQRGGGRTRVKAFMVRAGRIQATEPVRLRDLVTAVPRWLAQMKEPLPAIVTDEDEGSRRERSEQIAIVTHYLFRREAPGLFLRASELKEAEETVAAIAKRFRSEPEPLADNEQSPAAQDRS